MLSRARLHTSARQRSQLIFALGFVEATAQTPSRQRGPEPISTVKPAPITADGRMFRV